MGPELRPREAERSTQGHTARSVPSRPGWGSSCWPGVHRAGRALPHRRSLCPETQEGPGPQPCHPAREPPVCHHCPERPDRSVHLQRPLTYPAQHPGHSQAPQQGDHPSSPAPTIPALNPPQNLIGAPTATWCGPRSVLPGGLHGNLTWLVFLPRNPIKEGSLVFWSPSTLSGWTGEGRHPASSQSDSQTGSQTRDSGTTRRFTSLSLSFPLNNVSGPGKSSSEISFNLHSASRREVLLPKF